MEIIQSEIFRALGHLFIAGAVYFAGKMAYDEAIKNGHKKTLFKGFFWCVGVSFVISMMLGSPTCVDQDNRGCTEYADDGYEVTTNERIANFSYFTVLLYIPVIIGALSAKNKYDGEIKTI